MKENKNKNESDVSKGFEGIHLLLSFHSSFGGSPDRISVQKLNKTHLYVLSIKRAEFYELCIITTQ